MHSQIEGVHLLQIAPAMGALFVLVRLLGRQESQRLRVPLVLFALYGVLAVLTAVQPGLQVVALALGVLSVIGAAGVFLFGVVVPRLGLALPHLVADIVIAFTSAVAVFLVAAHEGVNLGGLLATSALMTAFVGLSLQDTLGNLVAGVMVQVDDTLHVGDWVRVGDINGRVTQIRWRYTTIETRNWETVVVPNSLLVKGQVIILGMRTKQPRQLRRWVYFNVDFRFSPGTVIETVEKALRAEGIPNVAQEPPPNCILYNIGDSEMRYAIRYWLTDIAQDDPTDGLVRIRAINALKRAEIPLSLPAKALFVTNDTEERRAGKSQRELGHRVDCLRNVGIFSALTEHERILLAKELRELPFAPGEVITRQGAEAHWLYVVISGAASVRIKNETSETEVAVLEAGSCFGEMGLLTGEPRSATVTALTHVSCYRVGKSALHQLLQARPKIADELSQLLAKRRTELEAARAGLAPKADEQQQNAQLLLKRIRSFFSLEDSA